MTHYSRRRRGYYGKHEPSPPSNFAGQVIIALACAAFLASALVIIASVMPNATFPKITLRCRL